MTLICVFGFVYTLLLRRNSRVKKLSSDSEWNTCSFANFSRSSDKDIMEESEEDVEEPLTHNLTSCVGVTRRFGRTIQIPLFFEGKIAQLNFNRRHLKFWNCAFQK